MEIKPVYVTFEQTKLLKSKEFNEPCIAFYTIKKELKPLTQLTDEFNFLNNSSINTTYCASTAPE